MNGLCTASTAEAGVAVPVHQMLGGVRGKGTVTAGTVIIQRADIQEGITVCQHGKIRLFIAHGKKEVGLLIHTEEIDQLG